MGNKVYVGNLPWSVDDGKLKELFAVAGEITEAIVIKNKYSGRSKGFGFVTFTDDASAAKAIAELNGKSVDGREIKVTEAKPLEPRDGDRRSEGNYGNDRNDSDGSNDSNEESQE